MHKLRNLIRQVNKTHKGLGPLVAINILTSKAKKCLLVISPAGCGKSVATDITHMLLRGQAIKYTSLTLAGLIRLRDQFSNFTGSIIIDDLGSEKSEWSRVSTINVLATIVHTHNIHKVTATSEIQLTNFHGSAALNIQPVLMNQLVGTEDWIAVVRDKALRYYHLIRPTVPKDYIPKLNFDQGTPLEQVNKSHHKGKLWYQLIQIGLTQWSYARCIEHIPTLLRATAAIDGRQDVTGEDYRILIKLLKPMQIERYAITSWDFETGRNFLNNIYCILVEIASHGQPTLQTISEDYKISPSTVERVVASAPEWCFKKTNSPTKIVPTEQCTKILNLCGVNQTW